MSAAICTSPPAAPSKVASAPGTQATAFAPASSQLVAVAFHTLPATDGSHRKTGGAPNVKVANPISPSMTPELTALQTRRLCFIMPLA
jgi:hypothetical protein